MILLSYVLIGKHFFIIIAFKSKTIATDKLNIADLKKEFKDVQSLKTNYIVKFYSINEPELKPQQ